MALEWTPLLYQARKQPRTANTGVPRLLRDPDGATLSSPRGISSWPLESAAIARWAGHAAHMARRYVRW
jgi:hypothetical protein